MSTTALSIIGYSFSLAEMRTIEDFNCRTGYAGGCFVAIYPGELPGTPEPHPECVGKKTVFIETELALRLTDEEYYAIFLHEEGHVACGHIERLLAGEAQSAQLELEADRYAVEHGADPMALFRAINKALKLASERVTMSVPLWKRKLIAMAFCWSIKVTKDYRLRAKQLKLFR